MTNRRPPASSAARDVVGHGGRRRRVDDEVGAVEGRSGRGGRRPAGRGLGHRRGLRRRRSPAQAGRRRERSWFIMVSSSCSEGRRGPEAVRRIKRPRSPWVSAAPGASVPGGSVGACRAPSEPQGPCLPAGPPELLLRLVGEKEAAHVHTMHLDWKSCKPLPGCRSVTFPADRTPVLPRTANPVDSRGPRPAIGRRACRGGLSSIGRASDCGSEGYGFNPRRPPQPPLPPGLRPPPIGSQLAGRSRLGPDAKMTRR